MRNWATNQLKNAYSSLNLSLHFSKNSWENSTDTTLDSIMGVDKGALKLMKTPDYYKLEGCIVY